MPTQIGSEVEFAKKGNLLISSTETSLGALRYSFPDDTHLMIEDSTGHQEIIEYTLEDEVLTLSDGAISLMLKPYKELEPTAANLAGAWTIPYDFRGEQDDLSHLATWWAMSLAQLWVAKLTIKNGAWLLTVGMPVH